MLRYDGGMNDKPKLIVRVVSAAELDKLAEESRERLRAELAANPLAPMPTFIDGKAKGVKVLWPKRR